MRERKMSLVASLKAGPTVQHHGMWRHPDTDNRFLEPALWEALARTLEDGCFDCVFFADGQGIPDVVGGHAALLERGGPSQALDPIQLLVVMARATQHLGVGATLSTTYIPPYLLARSMGTLDLLSKGRAAWNVVTSSTEYEARNFGVDNVATRGDRYDRADEVLEACFKLWGSWDADAIIEDRASGRFADGAKVHAANYEGKWIRTKGPLTVPHTPQGHPVIMQAGASDRGRDFAARWSEMIFAVRPDEKSMRAYYDDVKTRMGKLGRQPGECAILASVDIMAAETESIAREKQAYIDDLVTPEQGFAIMAAHLGFDPTQFPLDEPIVDIKTERGSRGMLEAILHGSREDGLTLRQAGKRYATTAFTPQIVGTPSQIADQLQHYFESGCCDGFIINPITMPGTFEQMTRMVVPELQRRGLFRTEYRRKLLRETVTSGE